MIEHFKGETSHQQKILEKYPKYLTKYSLMSLQKDDASLRMTFFIQALIFVQTLNQPITVEQKRDIKLNDLERTKLNELEIAINAQIKSFRSGKNIAEIVKLNESDWCKWKDEKAPSFERPQSELIKQKLTAFYGSEDLRKRKLKALNKD